MKQLIAGKTGPLNVSSAKAVHELMRKRVSQGAVEEPDIEESGAVGAKVKVRVRGSKVLALLRASGSSSTR